MNTSTYMESMSPAMRAQFHELFVANAKTILARPNKLVPVAGNAKMIDLHAVASKIVRDYSAA